MVGIQIFVKLLYHYKSLVSFFNVKSMKDVTPISAFADAFSDVSSVTGKPIVVVLPDYKQEADSMDVAGIIREARKLYSDSGLAVFEDINTAIHSIRVVSDYYR